MVFLSQKDIRQRCKGRAATPRVVFSQITYMISRLPATSLLLSALILLLFHAPILHAGENKFQEHHVKAVFLYNIANFVSWPAEAFERPDSPFTICILGNDPFGAILEQIAFNEHIRGRRIVIRRTADIKNICGCQILFISPSMKHQLPDILQAAEGRKILTIGDVAGFTEIGGTINLIKKGVRVEMEISIASSRKAGLDISSKLLNLAKIVDNRATGDN